MHNIYGFYEIFVLDLLIRLCSIVKGAEGNLLYPSVFKEDQPWVPPLK